MVTLTYIFATLLAAETIFAFGLYRPHKARLLRDAKHPAPLTAAQRRQAFERCVENIPDIERYMRLWFLGAEAKDIKRENVKDFLLWAFFDRDATADRDTGSDAAGDSSLDGADINQQVEDYVDRTEKLLGRELLPGRGSAKPLRLTIDNVETRYRSVIWYGIVGLVDFISHLYLVLHGFRYYAPSLRTTLSVFPPRLQAVPSLIPVPGSKKYRSASDKMGYWLRPHTSQTRLPIVFLHGIGIGVMPYLEFLTEIGALNGGQDDGQVGVLALEVLPISMRLTSPLLSQAQFVNHVTNILGQQAPTWDSFVLISHSYGSVLTTHLLCSPELGPRVKGVMLVDPVSVFLHLPDVAFNFTRRRPRTANEWQLWYFASMDLGIAEGLGRYFFWRENIIWPEQLLTLNSQAKAGLNGSFRDADAASQSDGDRQKGAEARPGRKVAVFLSGKDLIVDTRVVAQGLFGPEGLKDGLGDSADFRSLVDSRQTDGHITHRSQVTPSGMAITWFPLLDHAHVFEHKETRRRVLEMIREFVANNDAQ